jgi:CubicO group peptidase (beta-lactamase class C family)
VQEKYRKNAEGMIMTAKLLNLIQPEEVGFSSTRLNRIRAFMQRYVDEGQLAGIVSLVARRGSIVFWDAYGMQEIETQRPMCTDTLFRIYSMTKPIVSSAVLMLFEEGRFLLSDPVSRFIPGFKDVKVMQGSDLVAYHREVTIRDLLTHTSGLSYGFDDNSVIDDMIRKQVWAKTDKNPDLPLEEFIRNLLNVPLAFQPGTQYRYSLATDVLGYLVQVVSGMPLGDFLRQRIFEPLGMVDTGFFVPESKVKRFAATYGPSKDGNLPVVDASAASNYLRAGRMQSGGGGLVSTAPDYVRFAQMLLNGGELGGERLLGRKTVELMTMNHLPQGVYSFGNPWEGFGLGVSVLLDVAAGQWLGSAGNYGWSGAAGTNFWVDPREEMIGILMLQVMPSNTIQASPDFRMAAYQALVD